MSWLEEPDGDPDLDDSDDSDPDFVPNLHYIFYYVSEVLARQQ